MRFVEIELANGSGKRRVNPDQVAYLLANADDTATTLVFTGFAGGLLEMQAKGSQDAVARVLEGRPIWLGYDAGSDPARSAVWFTGGRSSGKSWMSAASKDLFGARAVERDARCIVCGGDKVIQGEGGFEPCGLCAAKADLRSLGTGAFITEDTGATRHVPLYPEFDPIKHLGPEARAPGATAASRGLTSRLPSKRAKRRAAGKAAQTPKGKS